MKFGFSDFMTISFYVNKIFGLSRFRKGWWFLFDIGDFFLVLLWFVGCSVSRLNFSRIANRIYNFQVVIMYISMSVIQIIPLCYWIAFYIACQNTHSKRLFSLSSQICGENLNLKSCILYQKFQIFFLCLPWFWSQLMEMYGRIWVKTYIYPKIEEKSTFYEYSYYWMSGLMYSNITVQFYCWTLLFRWSFQQFLKIESYKITRLTQNTLELLPRNTNLLHDAMNQLKIILELKQEISKLYGSFVFIYQFSCFMSFLLFFVVFILLKNINWQIYYLMECLYQLTISYMPHWMGQATTNEVSQVLTNSLSLLFNYAELKFLENFLVRGDGDSFHLFN